MAAQPHPPDPFFHQMQRKWKWIAIPFALLCIGGLVGIAIYDSNIGVTGGFAGAAFGLVLVLTQVFVFPGMLTRDPLRQEQQYWKWMPIGIIGGGIGAGVIEVFSEWTQLTLIAATCSFMLVMIAFRWWFETSDYARRKWPAPSASSPS